MSKLRSCKQSAVSHISSDLRTNQELINLRNAGRPGPINTVIFSIELVINFGQNDTACHVNDKSKNLEIDDPGLAKIGLIINS